jgi:hypothetical protein
MADGIFYTHDEFISLLIDTMGRQLTVISRLVDPWRKERAEKRAFYMLCTNLCSSQCKAS